LKKRSGKPLQGASARVAWRGRCRGQRRSFWNWRKGEGGLVAAAMANGGDGDSRVSLGKEVRGGREGAASEGEVRGGRGGAWRHRGVEEEAGGGQGKQEVAGAASALATHLFVLLAEEKDDKGALVGWAANWAASRLQ
jgi:hypothetical protein